MTWIKSIVYPPACFICCQACVPVRQFPGFCRSCLSRIQWISDAGTGFFWPDQLTHAVISDERIYGTAFYEEPLRSCLIRLKFQEQAEAASAVAPLMLRAMLKTKKPCDALVAVPLHRKRLKQRGYNQAALLVQSICSLSGYLDASDCLERIRCTRRQTEINNKAERSLNLQHAFRFNDVMWQKHQFSSQRPGVIWLVDDIVTTGATLQEAAKPLRMAGFTVNALVLAVNVKGFSLIRDV